jgi:predicted metal-binding membrane protein
MTNTTADPVTGGQVRGLLVPGPTLALWAATVAAWSGTLAWALESGNGPGTMGLGLGGFVAMWSLMMTAMMLPVTIASLARSQASVSGSALSRSPGAGAIGVFTGGYILLWVASSAVAYPAATGAGHLAAHDPVAARVAAVALFAVAGLYQMSNLKSRCLDRCRHHASGEAGSGPAGSGPAGRDGSPWRGGVRHATWCLGCSWALMALFIAVGVMNVLAMVLISVGLFVERHVLRDRSFKLWSGLAVVALGVAVAFFPSLAAGLHAMPQGMAHM